MKNNVIKFTLWLAILVFIISFSYLGIRRYQTLNSHYYDLGIMNQVVYNTSRGRFLEMTNQQLKRNASRLAIHFDPILAFFAPFYKIKADPSILLIGQTIIIGLGALAVFLLVKKIIKNNWLGFLFSLSYLFYFPIQRVVLFDFHAVALATSFFLWAIYFFEVKKYWPFFILVVLSLLTKEHVGLVVFFWGLYIIIFRKNLKIGLSLIVLGLGFFIASVYFIIPYFRQSSHFALGYFEDFGDSPSSIIFNIFRHPMVTARHLFDQESWQYVSRLILPTFYCLFSPLTLLIALPEWGINLLSINDNMRAIYFHYNSLIVPFIFYAFILGYKNFDQLIKNRLIKIFVLIIFLYLTFRSIRLYNPVPKKFVKKPVIYKEIDPIKKSSIDQWVTKLTDDKISVSTTPQLAPFFSSRQYYYNFLYDPAYSSMGYTDEDIIRGKMDVYRMADYVIINRSEIGDVNSGILPVKFYQKLTSDKDYQMIFSDNRDEKSIEVYKKVKSL